MRLNLKVKILYNSIITRLESVKSRVILYKHHYGMENIATDREQVTMLSNLHSYNIMHSYGQLLKISKHLN